MSVPAKRRSKSQHKRRASHFALTTASVTECASCGTPVKPHHACRKCGTYNGRSLTTRLTEVPAKKPKKETTKKKESAA